MNPILDRVRYFNKHVLNKGMMKIAGRNNLPLAVVYHKGRKSQKEYKTPIILARSVGSFIIALTYGPQVDWYRNVLAAGGCTILWHRKKYRITKIEHITPEQGIPAFPFFARFLLPKMHVQDFVKLS